MSKNEDITRRIASEEWPEESTSVTADKDALIIARLVLDGRPFSYVVAAKRLAQYVVDLNVQMDDIEGVAEVFAQDSHDTIPILQAAAMNIPLDE
jgi:hypothetical protein